MAVAWPLPQTDDTAVIKIPVFYMCSEEQRSVVYLAIYTRSSSETPEPLFLSPHSPMQALTPLHCCLYLP